MIDTDEMLIEAYYLDDNCFIKVRSFRRNTLEGAKGLADNLIHNHGYFEVKVYNDFGGDKSDCFYHIDQTSIHFEYK